MLRNDRDARLSRELLAFVISEASSELSGIPNMCASIVRKC